MTLLLEGVSRAMGAVPHVTDVTLALERGAPNVLLGPALSGKTSLMRLMAGLDRPDRGRILLDGADVTGVPARRRSVAMVYQQFVNYPSLTVRENIASPLRVAGLSRVEIEDRVHEAARLLRLEKLLDRLPPQISGGQQQRTAIARALVRRAKLVLLDEPLANLDYKLREELREELPRLFADTGAILVYATTEPAEALLLGGRTATLWQSRVTQCGASAAVYRRPDNLAAARVFSDPPLNELPVRREGEALVLPGGRRLPLPAAWRGLPQGEGLVAFRAEALTLGAPAPGELGFQGRVAVTEITGSESFVHLEVGALRWVALLPGVADLPPGTDTVLRLDPARAFAFGHGGERVAASPMLVEA